jgi:choline dehydrogenase-like flavoprotein
MLTQFPALYDAVIVGSGATGGWAAKLLTEAGMRVAVLEAGRRIQPTEFTEHKPVWELPYLGQSPLVARTRPIQSMTTDQSLEPLFTRPVAPAWVMIPGRAS